MWNIRGLNEPNKPFAIRKLQKENKCSMIGILETRVREAKKKFILSKFAEFDSIDNYSYSHKGRIWFLWDKRRVGAQIIEIADQFIHCKINLLDAGKSFFVTILYAWNEAVDRESLWAALRRLNDAMHEPWVVCGDFNTSLVQEERIKNGLISRGDYSELQQLVMETNLNDLRYSGNYLTWCNSQEGASRLYCKLDRAIINSHWHTVFDSPEAIFLQPGVSDHSPCLIKFNLGLVQKKQIFRFCDMWLQDEKFFPLVANAWQYEISGTPMYRLTQKLKRVKRALKELHMDSFSHLADRVAEQAQLLQHAQELLQLHPFDLQLQQQERMLKADYKKLVNAELALLKQKAKSDWLNLSDTNSKFFHNRIKERRAQCKITSIFTDTGELITDEKGVQDEFLKFYDQILCTIDAVRPLKSDIITNGPILSQQQGEALCQPVFDDEIKEAIFSIPSSKSPGPDGFTSGFYKATWHIMGNEVCHAIKDFFLHSKLLKEVYTTLITLVPKVACPSIVGDYRPIACCNIIYKAITKIIT